MTPEHGIWIVMMISLFVAVAGNQLFWRAAGLKLAVDSAAVALLGVGTGAGSSGLRVSSVLILIVGVLFAFLFVVLAFQFFRERQNDE